jgi:hypothetical protein
MALPLVIGSSIAASPAERRSPVGQTFNGTATTTLALNHNLPFPAYYDAASKS